MPGVFLCPEKEYSALGYTGNSGLLLNRDTLDLNQDTQRQFAYCEGCAGRRSCWITGRINHIHGFEISHIGKQAGGLNHICELVAGLLQYGPDIFHYLFGLLRDSSGNHYSGFGIQGNLPRHI